MLADPIERSGNRGGGAEKERPRNVIHDDVAIGSKRSVVGLARCVAAQVRHIPGGDGFAGTDLDGLRHAMKKKQRAQAETDHDAFGQVAEHDQKEGGKQDHCVAARGAQQRRELMAFRHVPSHGAEYRRQRGERDITRQRRRDDDEQQQEQRMQHAGERAARAGAHVGRRPRDGAGDTNAAEQRRTDIGDPLRHQFRIRTVTASGHAVGDHRRQQTFDAAQKRKRQGCRQHFHDLVRRNIGPCGNGTVFGIPPKRLEIVST
jgi:hypothetical protein